MKKEKEQISYYPVLDENGQYEMMEQVAKLISKKLNITQYDFSNNKPWNQDWYGTSHYSLKRGCNYHYSRKFTRI